MNFTLLLLLLFVVLYLLNEVAVYKGETELSHVLVVLMCAVVAAFLYRALIVERM